VTLKEKGESEMYETNVASGEGQPKHIIVIEDKSYEVPLAEDLSYAEANEALSGLDGYKAFLEKHLPKKVLEKLSVRQIHHIMMDWNKYSKEDMGIKPGESQALSGS
jgi:hypothetical protein